MTVNQFEGLNKIPVKTKKWVNVNEITITDYEMPKINPFNNVNIIGDHIEGIIIDKLQKGAVMPLNKKFIYGVGENLINQGERDFNEGYLIKIGKDIKTEKPIIIEFNMDENNKTLVDNIIIVGEENSKADIVVKYKSLDESKNYHNGVCKIFAKENSDIKLTKINLLNNKGYHFDSNLAEIMGEGNVNFIYVDFGARYSITNYHGDLAYENGKSTINSIYLGEGNKVIDTNYIMTHKGRRTNSEIMVQGALKDQAKKNFKGTIDFKRGAVKSKGSEEEYCMILSDKAKAKAAPLLLCEEEDVSGNHAASSGKINEEKLFYLMTRGISYEEARRLIIEAAFNPIIDKLSSDELKEEIVNEIKRRL